MMGGRRVQVGQEQACYAGKGGGCVGDMRPCRVQVTQKRANCTGVKVHRIQHGDELVA